MKPYDCDIGYDIESYPNVFSAYFIHVGTGAEWCFEISNRRNDGQALYDFLMLARTTGMRLVGFNNVGYDYTVIHRFIELFAAQGVVYAFQLWEVTCTIINSDERFGNSIPPWKRFIPQLDLYLIHHFDNQAKRTSLKMIEVNMKSHNVKDLPFAPGTELSDADIDVLLRYNRHDVLETVKFYKYSLRAIATREDLTKRYGTDFTNYNDTKIGKEFFIMELEKRTPGICFDHSTGRKKPRQTWRPNGIRLADVIFPYVEFRHPEFQRVLNYLKSVTIFDTKGAPEMKNVYAEINGFRFDFGTGGIHGSIEKRVVRSDDTHIIIDADVTSFYPNLAIKNRVYPQHLGEGFCDAYEDLFNMRKQFPKKSAENLLYKLALNGVYGDSNNDYGPFKDPQYTMTITINGQLSLCMCAERVIEECDAEMIQANTDGFTVRIPRDKRERYDQICREWEEITKLSWEFVDYEAMWIRDVNNYISRSVEGKVKRVGAYQWHTPDMATRLLDDGSIDDVPGIPPERGWHQDLGGLIIPKAAEAVMLRGENLEQFIRSHSDPFDFMLRVKVPRSSRLVLHDGPFPQPVKKGTPPHIVGYKGSMPNVEQVQNITRYYVARNGRMMTKIMPPTARVTPKAIAPGEVDMNPNNERYMSVESGWLVAECNDASAFDWSNVNYDYYIEEARKLLLTPGDLFASL